MTVSLQVLEHIWTPGDFVRELDRVTRPGGTLVLSTPNRLTFSPGLARRERPSNLYHCREYDARGAAGRARRVAAGCAGHGRRPVPRPAAATWEAGNGSVVVAQQAGEPQSWSDELHGLVGSVTVGDFVLGPADDECLDLFVVVTTAS